MENDMTTMAAEPAVTHSMTSYKEMTQTYSQSPHGWDEKRAVKLWKMVKPSLDKRKSRRLKDCFVQ